MRDIPRNELLDKLAAGWKVRRKKWVQGVFYEAFHRDDLIADDWEGEPPTPRPKLLGSGSFFFAVEVLRFPNRAVITACHVVTHINRKAWRGFFKIAIRDGVLVAIGDDDLNHLSYDSINATDWEIWGYEQEAQQNDKAKLKRKKQNERSLGP